MTSKAERRRRAALAAAALLDWRHHMSVEDAAKRTAKEIADHESMQRYKSMITSMAEEANKPRTRSQTPCMMVSATFRGDGAVGAVASTGDSNGHNF
jgi:hypothetical protein